MFNLAACLDAALANARCAGLPVGPVWLLLTEIAGVHVFRALRNRPPDGWQASLRAEGRTLELRRADQERVLVTAGRQVQLKEGLELLVLGVDSDIPDSIPLDEGVARAAAADAVAVIPWGFGKWWGARGPKLSAFLDSPLGSKVLLGDNGNRARLWPQPSLFERVTAAGRRVLPGSDPLPLESQVNRVASYGLIVTMDIDGDAPFADLRALLLDPAINLPTYGRRIGACAFLRAQLAMQILKQRRP